MSLTVRVLFVVTLLLSIVIPFGYFLIGQRTKKRYKRAIGTNIFFFFSTVLIAGIMLFAGDPVQAAEAAGNTASNATGFGYLEMIIIKIKTMCIIPLIISKNQLSIFIIKTF